MYRHPRRSVAFLIALPLLLTGCVDSVSVHSSGNDQASTEAPPSAPTTPVLDSANDKPLPLDTYLLNPDQVSGVTRAQQELLSRCMRRFGLTYLPTLVSPPRDSDAPMSRTDGRYGHQSAELMARWGYHPEGGSRVRSAGGGTSDEATTPETGLVETGSSNPTHKFGAGGQIVNGQVVPNHGCIGEGNKELTGAVDGEVGDARIATDLKLATLKNSQDDPRTHAVFAQWSTCMKSSSYDYPDPVAALSDPEWPKSQFPTQRELRVATADAACRHKFNVVGVWYSVDFAYQQQAIKDNAAAMASAKASIEAQVRAAAQVLAS